MRWLCNVFWMTFWATLLSLLILIWVCQLFWVCQKDILKQIVCITPIAPDTYLGMPTLLGMPEDILKQIVCIPDVKTLSPQNLSNLDFTKGVLGIFQLSGTCRKLHHFVSAFIPTHPLLKVIGDKSFKDCHVVNINFDKGLYIGNTYPLFGSIIGNSNVISLAISGEKLCAALENGYIYIKDSGNSKVECIHDSLGFTSLLISNGELYTSNRYGIIKSWDLGTTAKLTEFNQWQRINVFVISNGIFYAGTNAGDIKIRDLKTKNNLKGFLVDTTGLTSITSLAISDGKLWVGFDNGTIEIWDLGTHTRLKTVQGEGEKIISLVTFNGDFCSCSEDGQIKIWDSQGECLKTFKAACPGKITSFATSNGKFYLGFLEGETSTKMTVFDFTGTQSMRLSKIADLLFKSTKKKDIDEARRSFSTLLQSLQDKITGGTRVASMNRIKMAKAIERYLKSPK